MSVLNGVSKPLYLLSRGANKNVKDEDGKTPSDVACHWAYDKSQREIIRELLK